ncbi:hypothetical protein KR044_010570, partial [Drosophila immigrans]
KHENKLEMSNESSASETTPLRRPDSQSSANSGTNVATNNNHVDRSNLNTGQTALDIPSSNSNHPHNLTNSHVGERLHNDNNQQARQAQQQQQQQKQQTIDMDTNRRILFRVGFDILILLCAGLPILLFFLMGTAYERGFFCDDESLMHPFKESTVKNWMLYFIGLVIPVGVMLIVEILRSQDKDLSASGASRRYIYQGYRIPEWLVECYKKMGAFAFGAAISQMTTDIAKYSIGRLRPHFLKVCQPVMPDGTNCSDPSNFGTYITDFKCIGAGSTARMLKEMRLSFPSGHSSFTFYTMVYVAVSRFFNSLTVATTLTSFANLQLYLQSRMTWNTWKLLRHFLQFLFIMIAWYTALSRISDYKHHWSDVLAGSTIGATCALVVANCVSDLFPRETRTKPYLPRSSQDVSQTQSTVVVTTN